MVNRKKLGLSQTELAEKLNVSNKLINKWETGTHFIIENTNGVYKVEKSFITDYFN